MQQRNMPKLIHWFGANDTALPSQMAAFLIVSARLDTCWDRSRLHVLVPLTGQAHAVSYTHLTLPTICSV